MTLTELLPTRRNRQDIVSRRDNLFEGFFDDFAIESFGGLLDWSHSFVPSIDITEDEKKFHISAELPGMDENDIELSLEGDELTLKGEKKQENREKGKNYYRSERSYGSFQRIISLNSSVDKDSINAGFKKGVLMIDLPKVVDEKSKVKTINIKGS